MRILVISNNPFSNSFNNGKTLESLFSWVPKDDLAQLFFHASFEPDFSYCKSYYRLSDVDVLKNMFTCRQVGESLINDKKVGKSIGINYGVIRQYLDLSNFQLFRDYFWKIASPKKERLHAWVEVFSPDVIFFVGGDCGFAHDIVAEIVKRHRVKLYSYFTDDYVVFPEYKNVFKIFQARRLRTIYNKTIELSTYCFTIGDAMASAYSQRFNKKFIAVMNSIVIGNPPLPIEREEIVITYTGNLGINRWQMIGRLAEELMRLREKFNLKCVLNVYSTNLPSRSILTYFHSVGVVFRGFVVGDALKKVIMDSDILLHVESDNHFYRSFTYLSVSTKIPEYLSSKRVILAFGPVEVASINLLIENDIGFVISSESSSETIHLELYDVLCNADARRRIADNAFKFACKNYDLVKVQKKIKEYF